VFEVACGSCGRRRSVGGELWRRRFVDVDGGLVLARMTRIHLLSLQWVLV
jgi:hypothetical protein